MGSKPFSSSSSAPPLPPPLLLLLLLSQTALCRKRTVRVAALLSFMPACTLAWMNSSYTTTSPVCGTAENRPVLAS